MLRETNTYPEVGFESQVEVTTQQFSMSMTPQVVALLNFHEVFRNLKTEAIMAEGAKNDRNPALSHLPASLAFIGTALAATAQGYTTRINLYRSTL